MYVSGIFTCINIFTTEKNLFIYLPINVIQVYNLYDTGHGSTRRAYIVLHVNIFLGERKIL